MYRRRMLFGRVTRDEPDCASCLLGEDGAAAAAAVDPRPAVAVCLGLGLARYMGLHLQRACAATLRGSGHPVARAG